jgi:hypothetical protein
VGASAAMTSDIKTPTPDEAIARPEAKRRTRPLRVLARTSAIVLMLGAGWVAGIKTHDTLDIAQLSSAAWTGVAGIGAFLETSGTRIVAGVRNLAQRTTTSSLAMEGGASAAGADEHPERIQIDQVRALSEVAVEGLRGTMDRVVSSMESNQQLLVAKLENLGERLDRVERNAPAAAGAVSTKLEQLNERLDRIERSAAVALSTRQAPALASSPTSAAKPAAELVQASPAAPAATPSLQAPVETKKVAGWVVREVINGKAILQGPRGLIGVSTGDIVPGVGRVGSIARQGGRWIVATNKGVISAR